MLKILSWNIRQGGGTRSRKICDNLVASEAQLIVLSEFRNNKSGDRITKTLSQAGYKFQGFSGALGNTNSVAIFSIIDGETLTFSDIDPKYSDNIIAIKFEAFTVYGVYLPHKKKHILFDFLINEVSQDKSAIIVGDFNTGKNFIDQKGSSFWYTEELRNLENLGCVDAFRHIHKDKKEFSWFSHLGNGYRYDHSYVSRSIVPIIKECYYLHSWREEKLSDHSPMILELA